MKSLFERLQNISEASGTSYDKVRNFYSKVAERSQTITDVISEIEWNVADLLGYGDKTHSIVIDEKSFDLIRPSTAKLKPYFDTNLLSQIDEVLGAVNHCKNRNIGVIRQQGDKPVIEVTINLK